jgi:16S rRNA (uracil1498-N3)-methyltransferase
MSERFYINLPLHPGMVELTGPEAHHLATVCRLRPGAAICLFNGDGREYPACVHAVARKAVQIEIQEVREPHRELPFALEVAAPLPKGDRGQFLVEKLTELGVTTYVPLSCQRSVVHPREGKLDKLHRHIIEASKQCGRNVLMQTRDLEVWDTYCRPATPGEVGLLAHPGGPQQVGPALSPPQATAVRVAVGPEGGFTDTEVTLARDRGWRLIDLGPRILRVETAALALAVRVIAAVDWLTKSQTLGTTE